MSLSSSGSKLFLHVIIITSSFIACKGKADPSSKLKPNPPTIVDVIIAAPQSITNHIEVNGTVVANEYVELHPEASGRIIYLNVPEGRMVKTGTIIARVNDADLKAQIQKTKVQ